MAVQTALKSDLTDVYDDVLHSRFIAWRDEADRTVGSIAKMLGRSTAAVSQYINKKFQGDLAGIEKDITNLLRREEDLQFVQGPIEVCNTTIAERIWESLQYCDEKGKGGAVLAPSGSGKSIITREYKRKNRATVLVTADISTRRPGAVLNLLSAHVGGAFPRRSISNMLESLINRLKGSRRLIIVDDSHFLSWEAFEILRKIHDCAGVGIVFVGQPRLYEQMRGGEGKSYLYDQIFSRIAIKRDKFTVTKKDTKKIVDSVCPGLDKASIDFLFAKARGKGRFRVMMNLLDVAMEISKQYGKPIDIKLLRQAEQFLMG